MSGFITASGENYLLDLFTASTGPLPTYFFALGRSKPPTRHSTGTEFDEPVTVDYQRAPYVNSSGNWSERVSQTVNATAISFPVCTTAWGVIKYWAIANASKGGNLLWAGNFSVPLKVGPGDQVILTAGAVNIKPTGYVTRVML